MSTMGLRFEKNGYKLPAMDINEQIASLRAAKKRRAQALAMHKQRISFTKIGAALGVTRERARQLVAKAIKESATA